MMKPTLIIPKIVPKPAVNETQGVTEDSELQERIRIRAFELYEQRGRRDGGEVDDWLQAERELTVEAVAA